MASKIKAEKIASPRKAKTPVGDPIPDVSSTSDIRPAAIPAMGDPGKPDPDQLELPMTPPKRQRLPEDRPRTKVQRATRKESTEHERYMEGLRRERGGDD